MPDLEQIVARLQGGDAGALEELYRLLGGRVFGLAYHLLASREDAEDAVSEVFLRLRRSAGQFDGRVPFDKWLLRITSHLCIDWLRRKQVDRRLFEQQESTEDHASSETPSPLEELLTQERSDAMLAAIQKLPDAYRVPLVLRYYGDLNYDEIGAELGTDRNQAGVLLFRAKKELRRIWEGESR